MFRLKLILFFACFNALASEPVAYREKGYSLSEGAFVFTPEAELKARLMVVEKDFYKQFSETQTKQIELYKENNRIYEERLNNFKAQNDNLSEKLVSASSSNKLENALYFIGGAVITGFMGYGIYKAATLK